MRVVNRTGYRTDDLRAFVRRVALLELPSNLRRGTRVTFIHSRMERGVHGDVNIAARDVRIFIPPPGCRTDLDKPMRVAVTLAHEFHHIATRRRGRSVEYHWRRSVRYGRPRTQRGREAQVEVYSWVSELRLRSKEMIFVPTAAFLLTIA
jgi:hypothetical protein